MTKTIGTTSFGLGHKWIIPALFVTLAILGAFAVSPAYSLDSTTTTVLPNPSSVTIGNTITYTATVTDTSASPTTPGGPVSWADGAVGGSFSNSGSCALDAISASCTIIYTPPSVANPVTITATYSGDGGHLGSSGTSTLTVSLRTTSTIVSPNPSTAIIGNTITYTATVADISSGSASTPTGTASWSDGSAGGSFSNSGSCTLLSGTCTTVYTLPSTPGSVTITATYGGDPTHAGSSGTSSLTVLTPAQATQNLIKLVNSLNLPHGITNSLNAKLRAATNSLNRGNPTPAKNQVNAFINEVKAQTAKAQTGKKITSAQAAQLIAAASDIIKALH